MFVLVEDGGMFVRDVPTVRVVAEYVLVPVTVDVVERVVVGDPVVTVLEVVVVV